MGKNSGVEWCDHSWGPWRGCHKVDLGCDNCYGEREMLRYGRDPHKVVRAKAATFYGPLRWKEPARVFTCPWSDFFIEEADQWRREASTIIHRTPHLTYIIPTKRPERILKCLPENYRLAWDNVWLGISASDQESFKKRWIEMMKIARGVRFASLEPLLGLIHVNPIFELPPHWVIVGGESGPNARPMHPDWVRRIRDDCIAANIPFFFKQWGMWEPLRPIFGDTDSSMGWHGYPKSLLDDVDTSKKWCVLERSGKIFNDSQASPRQNPWIMQRVGKKKAGDLLDGKEWHQWPE